MQSRIAVSAVLALLAAAPAAAERTGEQVVKMQCIKCHGTGVNGAPRIDDRAAWIPRMRQGLDATVRSAAKGHGAMPARGGMAELTDSELRAAISYMFYPAGAGLKEGPPAAGGADPHLKVVDGMEVRLGVVPAAARGSYLVSVSLREAASEADIRDASVEARVASALGGATRTLKVARVNNATVYSGEFSAPGNEPYTVTVHVRRPGAARASQATFDLRP